MQEFSSDLEQEIKQLSQHKEQCVQQGDYLQAEKIFKRIKSLQKQSSQQKKHQLKAKQNQETEDAKNQEHQFWKNFNQQWEQVTQKLHHDFQLHFEQTKQKQATEFQNFKRNLETTMPLKPKPLPKKLEFIRCRDKAIKQEDYKSAHYYSQEIKACEEQELKIAEESRRRQIDSALEKKAMQQKNELEAFKEKTRRQFDEIKKKRESEMEKANKKIVNSQKVLERAQSYEKNLAKGNLKNSTASRVFSSITLSKTSE